MGSVLGKSSSTPTYTAPSYSVPDMSGYYNTALTSFQNNMTSALSQAQMQMQNQMNTWQNNQEEYSSSLPEVIGSEAAGVDWEKKSEELKAKMKADYELDKANRVGKLSTVLTSPLLDTSTPVTTGSLLTGA